MNKRSITTILLAIVALTGLSQTKIWDKVVTGFANVPYLKLTKVAMYDDQTDITLHLDYIKGMGISIAPNTVLKADGHDYALKEVTTLTIGEEYTMPDDTLNIVLTFEPLPATTKKFDFVEPNGWQMLNVRSADYLPEGIVDTYWRDNATGDWLMGFAPNHVIYQNKVWTSSARQARRMPTHLPSATVRPSKWAN